MCFLMGSHEHVSLFFLGRQEGQAAFSGIEHFVSKVYLFRIKLRGSGGKGSGSSKILFSALLPPPLNPPLDSFCHARPGPPLHLGPPLP